MSKELDAFVEVAMGEIGEGEDAKGETKYGKWFGYPTGSWCAMFVSWCANQAGILTTSDSATPPYFKKSSTVSGFRSFFAQNRRDLAPSSNPASSNYPQIGDLAVIDNSGGRYAHVGIVVSTNGNEITTVEGNLRGKVKKVTYTDLYAEDYGTISLLLSNNITY